MKKLTCTLLLGGLAFACTFAGCSELTTVEKYEKEGYVVSVTYDGNGGSFMGISGVSITDMFNPSNYEKENDGTVHIKLMEPTHPDRPSAGGEKIELTMEEHFFAGWYQNREVKMVDDKPVDEAGNELVFVEEDGYYYYPEDLEAGDTEENPLIPVTPAYTYSGYWDFANDVLVYDEEEDEKISMTLYAAWVPYYEFHYYYQVDGEWTQHSTVTKFDYKTTQLNNDEADTIYTPVWDEGALNHKHTYANYQTYNFPSVTGMTFEKAYSDADLTNEITNNFKHSGNLIVASGAEKTLVVENRIQNIYIEYSEGVKYRIETAAQFLKNANPNGEYEIFADELDFSDVKDEKGKALSWPATFSAGTFAGKIFGTDGKAVTFKNITATYSSTGTQGGLFGKISKDAEIKNVTFSNVTLDITKTGKVNEAVFGLLAGEIEEGADVSVTLNGGTLKLGAITPTSHGSFHLVANGDISGVTVTDQIGLTVYGTKKNSKYRFTIDTDKITVAEDGTIGVTFYATTINDFDDEVKFNNKFEIKNTTEVE